MIKTEKLGANWLRLNGWKLMALAIALHAALFLGLAWMGKPLTSYDADNYRYVFSALLQVVGGLFAFIASSTLVVLQLLHTNAPHSARFYPKNVFTLFLVDNVLVLLLDAMAILMLETETSLWRQVFLEYTITFNLYPMVLAFVYIYYVIRYLTPEYQAAHILRQAERAKDNEERRLVLYSLEEMMLTSVQAGQGGNVRLYQDAFSDIIAIYAHTKEELNAGSQWEPENPLRMLPDVIERITDSLIDHGMRNLLHFNGHILRELSGASYQGNTVVGVEIAVAVEHIATSCLERSCVIDLTNFCANFIWCADEEDNIDTILWGTRLLLERLSDDPSPAEITVFNSVVGDLRRLMEENELEDGFRYRQMAAYLKSRKKLIQACVESGQNYAEKGISEIQKLVDQKYSPPGRNKDRANKTSAPS